MNELFPPLGKAEWPGVQNIRCGESEVTASSLLAVLTLGKSINFSEPQVLYLYNEDMILTLKEGGRINEAMATKHIKLHRRGAL